MQNDVELIKGVMTTMLSKSERDALIAGWQRAGALFRLCAWTALRTLVAHV